VDEAWTANISSWTFVNLSTNTRYGYQLYFRESPGLETFYAFGDTRTLAVIPGTPTINSNIPGVAVVVMTPLSNPQASPNDTEFAIMVQAPGTPHDGLYLPTPNGAFSVDMNGAASTPTWKTYSGWGGSSGVSLTNLFGFVVYTVQVKARNGYLVETATGPGASALIPPGPPKIQWKTNLPESSWINTMVTSFTALNSAHYHYRFNQNFNDRDNVTSLDPSFNNGDVIVTTATAEGAWYFHAFGDLFGFSGQTSHVPLLPNQRFSINIDTTVPVISTISAQFSPTDNTPIYNDVATGHKSPYFSWTSPITNAILESPIAGYSVLFATGADPGEVAVSSVVVTTNTGMYFQVSQPSDRPNGTYYFRVKAQDTAGNWGPSSLFIYRVLTDNTAPQVNITVPSPTQSSDGRRVCVKSSMTIEVVFDDDIKSNTVTSTSNVRMIALRDNLAHSRSIAVDVMLSYNSASRTLYVSPVSTLFKGWLYQIVVSTSVTDLAGNPLQSEGSVYFETLMDRNAENRIVASDSSTVITIPAGSMPEDFSVLVGVISGGIASAAPSIFQGLQFASQQTLNSANQKMSQLIGAFAQPVAIREFSALNSSGQLIKSNFLNSVSVDIPYVDADGDGFVDGTSPRVRVKKLSVYVLDETHGLWTRIPNGSVDASARRTSARVQHFSVYSVFGAPDTDVSLSYAFPVPFRPSLGHTNVVFTQLPSEGSIRIYTVAGELVRKIDFLDSSSGQVTWDVTNSGGEPLGSDVYVYIVQSGDNKKIGKLMVIR
jgi:hypothetical protein